MQTRIIGDNELVKSYIAGDENSLSELVNRYKDRVYTAIYIFVKDELLAEDIFQDTFIKVIENLRRGNYYEDGKFLPWVMRIAHNLCVDHYRKTKRNPTIINSEGQDVFNFLRFAEDTPHDAIARIEASQKVRTLIEALPSEQKEVIMLRHYADLSFKEIADITQVSINTALGRMRYALINIRKMISEQQIVL
ncbi:MAG: sigma-70 family RNA polymerase sigma factor [Sphingobacteriales bacterium]|jgi:RNA polymerase sigma factor (sigma-70 family)|nr:sigma-70 family RNA polymerase sigma factor [Sphingobacteriales bacterium]MCC7058434.1 sigma-70 family RNA polymerase sigma factor [Chitinophagales bacterium]MDA0199933.1 sigma-70 family RNA polymerase sigma factor [Bacteroidota bacterium]MBK6888625.1 sigma-70 family RNA polymerase sigma factor [Sphingobacteriales bacterium]MBK7528865.1 sigma-70 family RNA polymerase sigma factor [Sphingobacteriales bacterium]